MESQKNNTDRLDAIRKNRPLTKYVPDGVKPNYAEASFPYIPEPREVEFADVSVWPPVYKCPVFDTIGPAPKYFVYEN